MSIVRLSTVAIDFPQDYSICPNVRLVREAAIFDALGRHPANR